MLSRQSNCQVCRQGQGGQEVGYPQAARWRIIGSSWGMAHLATF
jgi:hypothetical protein